MAPPLGWGLGAQQGLQFALWCWGAASGFPCMLGKTAIAELHHQLKGGSFWMLLLCLKRKINFAFC